MVILGIDPGTLNLGYGAVQLFGSEVKYLEHGVLTANPKKSFSERILQLGNEFSQVVDRLNPKWMSIENIFMGKNADSAFKLGHIRGVCMFEAAKKSAKIAEYSTREIKKGVTGSGSAEKTQVALLLEAEFGLTCGSLSESSLDASDALAAAFFHAQKLIMNSRLDRQVT
jgi:crossover junction endodeoxyribonuclease RuvC